MGAIAAILERRRQEEEEQEKNREEVFPCMMTDGLYLDDATQRVGGGGGRLPGKSKKGWRYFCFENLLQSPGKFKPERPHWCQISLL